MQKYVKSYNTKFIWFSAENKSELSWNINACVLWSFDDSSPSAYVSPFGWSLALLPLAFLSSFLVVLCYKKLKLDKCIKLLYYCMQTFNIYTNQMFKIGRFKAKQDW